MNPSLLMDNHTTLPEQPHIYGKDTLVGKDTIAVWPNNLIMQLSQSIVHGKDVLKPSFDHKNIHLLN